MMIGLQVPSIEATFRSVNLDVIAFLFSMYTIVFALDRADVLKHLALKILSVAKTSPHLLMMLWLGRGYLQRFWLMIQ